MSPTVTDRPSGMGELVITTFMTLDGVMQAPGGATRTARAASSTAAGRRRCPTPRPASGCSQEFQTWDAYLLGRRTYDIFASFWPKQPRTARSRGSSTICPGTSPRARSRRPTGRARPSSTATSPQQVAEHQGAPRADRRSGAAPTSSRRCCATTSSTASISGSTRSSWARASASSPRASSPQRSAGRRSRRSTAARSTPSTSTPAGRRTRDGRRDYRHRACSCGLTRYGAREARTSSRRGVRQLTSPATTLACGGMPRSSDAGRAGARGRTSTPSRPRADSGR